MSIKKEIKNNEIYLWMNGKLIFKKWIDENYSEFFDRSAWVKYTTQSITEFDLKETPSHYSLKSELYVFTNKEGGNGEPILNGSRPEHIFNSDDINNSKHTFIGDIQLFGKGSILPGEKKEVCVRFFSYQSIEEYLTIGNRWNIYKEKNS